MILGIARGVARPIPHRSDGTFLDLEAGEERLETGEALFGGFGVPASGSHRGSWPTCLYRPSRTRARLRDADTQVLRQTSGLPGNGLERGQGGGELRIT